MIERIKFHNELIDFTYNGNALKNVCIISWDSLKREELLFKLGYGWGKKAPIKWDGTILGVQWGVETYYSGKLHDTRRWFLAPNDKSFLNLFHDVINEYAKVVKDEFVFYKQDVGNTANEQMFYIYDLLIHMLPYHEERVLVIDRYGEYLNPPLQQLLITRLLELPNQVIIGSEPGFVEEFFTKEEVFYV